MFFLSNDISFGINFQNSFFDPPKLRVYPHIDTDKTQCESGQHVSGAIEKQNTPGTKQFTQVSNEIFMIFTLIAPQQPKKATMKMIPPMPIRTYARESSESPGHGNGEEIGSNLVPD